VVSSSVNDAGHGGVADVTAVLFSMQRPDGSAAGQGWISCVNILATDQLCHAAFVLANGQIQAQAEIPMAATTFTAAITGGTGAFEGVSGRVDNVRVAPGVIDRTFHLLAHHH
jgi:meiotically up-regulated gene 157 (Mug157) protein